MSSKIVLPTGGYVELISSWGSDLDIANVARVSFKKHHELLTDGDKRLIRYLWEHEHTSPFRHQFFKFRAHCPIFVLRQWMKHVIGCSWNEASGRYVEFDYDFHRPDVWRSSIKDVKQGSGGPISAEAEASCTEIYLSQMESSYRAYRELLENGVCREQARMVLPLSLMSDVIWTCSLHAVLHFLKLRLDSHAQAETRAYASAVYDLIDNTGAFDVALASAQLPNHVMPFE